MIVLIIAKILQDKLWDIVMTLRFYFQDTTSFLTYILNHLQGDSLYRQLSRIEIQHSSCVGLVLRVKSRLAILPEETLEGVAILCESYDNVTVIGSFGLLHEHEVALVNADIHHRVTVCLKEETLAIDPLFGYGEILNLIFFLGV